VFDAVAHSKLINNFLRDAVEVDLPRFVLNHQATATSLQTNIHVGLPPAASAPIHRSLFITQLRAVLYNTIVNEQRVLTYKP